MKATRVTRTLGSKPGAHRRHSRRARGGILRLDGRDGRGQELATDGAWAGVRRQGIGRLGPVGQDRSPRGRGFRDRRPRPAERGRIGPGGLARRRPAYHHAATLVARTRQRAGQRAAGRRHDAPKARRSCWSTSTGSSKGEPCSTRTANASCSTHTVGSTRRSAPIGNLDRLTRHCGARGKRFSIR